MSSLLVTCAPLLRSGNHMERLLYRQLLRYALRIDASTSSRARELQRFRGFLPGEVEQGLLRAGAGSESVTLPTVLRRAFDGAQDDASMDRAFAALRTANRRAAALASPDHAPKPTHVKWDVGQVYRHKKHGFRGVIVEWFDGCPADENWVEAYGPFEKGIEQAFYRTFVDTKDRPNPFTALAAEENLEPLSGFDQLPVEHPMMERLFCEDFEGGRHWLKDEFFEDFPDDF